MEQLRFVFGAFISMGPIFTNLLAMLLMIIVLYAQIGTHLFGGLINSNTPNDYAKVGAGAFGTNFERSNFNDFPNSMMMMWNMVINNCWPNLMNQVDIYMKEEWMSMIVVLFYYSFVFFTCYIVMNILTGFIIDLILGFLATAKDTKAKEEAFEAELNGGGKTADDDIDEKLSREAHLGLKD